MIRTRLAVSLACTAAALVAASAARADAVTVWNATASNAIVTIAGQPPPSATLSFAIVQAAVYDAVNAIDQEQYRPYLAAPRANPWDSKEAAVAAASFNVLASLFPAQVTTLQSTYDTYVKNTVIEAGDSRLPKLRGHVSAALHLLGAVTHLTHFVERHESGMRNDAVERRIGGLVRREDVRDITLNHLLYWAAQFMRRGRALAEDLLPSYTNVQVLEVELADDLTLHARPAALIVGIVNRYGTPVEMEVDGKKCNAASILDLMVTVGSRPDIRRFIFRGDVNPLRDIQLLFRSGVGESGIDGLPPALSYLRSDS